MHDQSETWDLNPGKNATIPPAEKPARLRGRHVPGSRGSPWGQKPTHLPDAKILIGGCNYQNTIADIERITLSDLVNEFDGYVVDAYTGNWKLNLGEPTLPEAAGSRPVHIRPCPACSWVSEPQGTDGR